MFSIFKKKDKDTFIKGNSNLGVIDNIKSYYTKKNIFNISYPFDRCFYGIIKLSFSTFKSGNWRNIKDINVGDIFKSKVSRNKFTITELKMFEVYEIKTIIDDIEYWTRFEVKKIKNNKTQVNFSESLKFPRAIYGFKGTIAKMNFNKNFDKKAKEIVLRIHEEVKNIDINSV
ncbi:hypothetical protein SCORR_v1c06620 [Spiroplasma corruscae]|uniref:Uncharacterized protein n=1 Tax=Spiroplasma corruscae TaxID=216934 RepID=A0A222EQ76_9MOLU|nr:DUF3284 domain-containing protein [Spiroplasma corruscae]ASP28434.1 hypothetical protein SCORR_v1c06620 [Spiroplasma corruscae]